MVSAVSFRTMAHAEDTHGVLLEGEQDAIIAHAEPEAAAMLPCSM